MNSVSTRSTVPIWVRMEKYKAGERQRLVPDGMRWGPVVRIGTYEFARVQMFGYHNACGLRPTTRSTGIDAGRRAVDGGRDLSPVRRAVCAVRRRERVLSATSAMSTATATTSAFGGTGRQPSCDGGLVCRDCEVCGLIAAADARTNMDRAHKLASFIGGDALSSYERGMAHFAEKTTGGGRPCQTRLYPEDKYSFGWSALVMDDDGKWKRWIHGGFIKHGPNAEPAEGGGYDFTTWDYGKKCVRAATPEEISHTTWNTHT